MDEKRNVTFDKSVFDISKKEVTIPLTEYKSLITKEFALKQIRDVVSNDKCDYGTILILKAILQINIPKKEEGLTDTAVPASPGQ